MSSSWTTRGLHESTGPYRRARRRSGIGVRPFVYRLAKEAGLAGWVLNSPQGVFIEAEGAKSRLDELSSGSKRNGRHALSFKVLSTLSRPLGPSSFEIRESDKSGACTTLVLPDIATCPDCIREIFDPQDRRYRYPFTNCSHCGPRFTIIHVLPYDRVNTSMKGFMCRGLPARI